MNRTIKLTIASALAATIAACGSSSSSSGGGSNPSALTITEVTAPAGSLPAQNLGAGMGSGSVYVESTTGTPLYLLGNATGSVYAPLTADVTVTSGPTIIGAWLTSSNILFGPAPSDESVAYYFSADLTLPLSTTSNTATWKSATLTNTNRTICFGNPIAGASGCAGSNAPTGARLVVSNSGNTQFMFVGYGQPGVQGAESIGYNILSDNGGLGTPVESEAYVSLAACIESGSGAAGQGATTVSAIAASSIESSPVFLAGTNSGDICAGIIYPGSESDAFESAIIVNATTLVKQYLGANYTFESSPVTVESFQATGGYNTLGAVNSLAATPQGSNNSKLLIAWVQGTSGLYSITLNPSRAESSTFANLLDTSVYSNAPSNQALSVIYVDFSNNIYVGTFSNMVYVLPNGSTTWLSVAIPNPGDSHIYNFSAGYNGNVYAYTADGSSSAVYSLSF